MSEKLSSVLDQVNLVVVKTRMVNPIRDTGEGKKNGSRIEKVLQSCFDAQALRPLTRKKQEATRICRAYGTKVEALDAWAVPLGRTAVLLEMLVDIAQEWDQLVNVLAGEMGARVRQWAQANPGESSAIMELAPSEDEVRSVSRFIFTSFRLRAEDVDDNGCLQSELSGLAGQTLHEFAVALRDSSLDKGTGAQYTQGVKDVLGRIAVKARSLEFLDPRIAEVATVLESAISVLPAAGTIAAAHAVLIKSIIDQMLQPRRLMTHGFAMLDATTVPNMQPQQVLIAHGAKPKLPTSLPVPAIDFDVPATIAMPVAMPALPSQVFTW